MYGVFTYDCGALPKHYASYHDLGDANREVDYLTNLKAWVFERDASVRSQRPARVPRCCDCGQT
jgi:hypothetical protein